MSLTGCTGRRSLAARHTRLDGPGDEVAWLPEDPLRADGVAETRDHRVAAVHLLPDLRVAQGEQVRHDHRQPRVVRDARRETLGRPDHGAHAEAAAQKLLQDAAAGPSGAAEEQHRLLGVSCRNVHHFSFGYWNTSSSGTSNTRAIWKAISSDGE